MAQPSPQVAYALSFFPDAKRVGSCWKARCAVHQEKTPSLVISEGEDGRALFHCHGCGAGFPEITAALQMDIDQLFATPRPEPKEAKPAQKKIVATYNYVDEHSELLYQVVRYQPKDFRQRQPQPGDTWKWSLVGVRRVLYHLPEVVDAIAAGQTVYLCEGEKDADRLRALGLCATTNAQGAGKWQQGYTEALRGGHVVLLPDNDEPGRKHVATIAPALLQACASVKVVELPELPEKGDVSDWLAAGGSREELEALVESAPLWSTDSGTAAEPIEPEEPLPLPRVDVEPFPLEVFPEPLQRLCLEAAAAFPCPPEYVGVPMLTVLGVAIGTSRVVEVKGSWREGPRLYTAVVAEPGSKKSPALDLALSPLMARQDELRVHYDRVRQKYLAEHARYEQALAAWRESLRKNARGSGDLFGSEERPVEPEEPLMEQVITGDATTESLAPLALRNPRGLAMSKDELVSWVRGMDAYRSGKGADRQFWLSLWSGSPIIVNRKSEKEPLVLRNPFIGVTGCLPPDVLNDLSDERGREDGFIHRILFAYPDRVPLTWSDATIDPATLEGYHDVCAALWRLSPAWDAQSRPAPLALPFTPEGRAIWVEWINDHYRELADVDFPPSLRGPWAKLEGYCARLALILHLARYVCGEADDERPDRMSVIGAAALVDYFKSHARRVYLQLQSTPEDKQIIQALDWVERHGGEVSQRDLLRGRVANVRTTTEARQLIRRLEACGYGVTETPRKNALVFRLGKVSTANGATVTQVSSASPGTNGGPSRHGNGKVSSVE